MRQSHTKTSTKASKVLFSSSKELTTHGHTFRFPHLSIPQNSTTGEMQQTNRMRPTEHPSSCVQLLRERIKHALLLLSNKSARRQACDRASTGTGCMGLVNGCACSGQSKFFVVSWLVSQKLRRIKNEVNLIFEVLFTGVLKQPLLYRC